MTKEEFKKEILDWVDTESPKEWRRGQSVFNYVDKVYGVARDVQFGYEIDCFYNDNLIDVFIDKAYELL